MRKHKKKILFSYLEEGKECLAIQYLSAALKRNGHKTDLIIEYSDETDFKKRLYNQINNFSPDFVAFSIVSDNYLWAIGVAKYIKEKFKIKTIFGGIHVTSCPEEVIKNNCVDYAVLGEGDDVIIDIVENPNRRNIKNVWLKNGKEIIKNSLRNLLEDLNELPIPDKCLFYDKAPHLKNKYYCIIGKGCPFVCTYCFNNYMKKLYHGQKWVRKRSVENVISELEVMKKKIGFKRVYFADDCLTDNNEWLREFVKEYKKKIDVPFTGQSHSTFLDKEVCKLLKDAGCIKMQVGAQTPLEEKRKRICRRGDSNKKIKEAVNNLKRVGILVQIDHIFKLPTETVEEYQKGLNFYIDLKPDSFVCFVLQYYPKIEITDIGFKNKEFDKETFELINKGQVSSITSLHRQENIELLNIYRFINWIPILPRSFSRYVVRKKLYHLFFSDRVMRIPFLFQYMTDWRLLSGIPLSLERRYVLRKTKKNLGKFENKNIREE